jgi:predicted RNA-binding protein YlxR (DUF448 family)
VPRRRCVGCGLSAPKSELLRIALVDGAQGRRCATLDREARLPGRGAYLHIGEDCSRPDPACLAEAVRRGGIARALRAKATLDPKLVESVNP